jgi:general stress protein 26
MQPDASRPYMPGYGIRPAGEGSGLLSWRQAEERLSSVRNYWLATARPDGRPHVMPVWGVWDSTALWFSSSLGSRKIANLRANPRCVMTTEDAVDPVVVEGIAVIVTDQTRIDWFLGASNAKYGTSYGADLLDPAVNATVRVEPETAFALLGRDFTGSPTRWRFEMTTAGLAGSGAAGESGAGSMTARLGPRAQPSIQDPDRTLEG